MRTLTNFDRIKPHIWFKDGAWECGALKGNAEARAITPFLAWRCWKMLNDGTVFVAQGAA